MVLNKNKIAGGKIFSFLCSNLMWSVTKTFIKFRDF